MQWHREENIRVLPWKKETDPYRIWLSEVILQQTRADQGLPYYLRFVDNYSTITNLANAPDEEVFRVWQGLGYYNRCKNLLATARFIVNELDGKFPSTHEELLKLKGVGAYTAAAIASFAFHLPHAVVDGNVNRVLSRYFGIETPFDTAEGKKLFFSLAQELLDTEHNAEYNQAIMDHGALVCTPQRPKCDQCTLRSGCIALKQDLTGLLPVKSKKLVVKKRYFHYVLLVAGNDHLWLRKREDKDIWQNLYEPLLVESQAPLEAEGVIGLARLPLLTKGKKLNFEGEFSQRLTHQLIETRFYSKHISKPVAMPETSGEWVKFSELKKIAFPKTIISFLEKKLYF